MILLLIFAGQLTSCTTSDDAIWPPPRNNQFSFEIDQNTGDTVNKSVYGYKQGKWYLRKGNNDRREIIDTVYYRNDTELVQDF